MADDREAPRSSGAYVADEGDEPALRAYGTDGDGHDESAPPGAYVKEDADAEPVVAIEDAHAESAFLNADPEAAPPGAYVADVVMSGSSVTSGADVGVVCSPVGLCGTSRAHMNPNSIYNDNYKL